MRRAIAETKSHKGVYKRYSITFKNEDHFNAWYNKCLRYGKVIGVQFLDGKGDNWKTEDDPHDAMIADQRWDNIKGINE